MKVLFPENLTSMLIVFNSALVYDFKNTLTCEYFGVVVCAYGICCLWDHLCEVDESEAALAD